MYVCMYVCIDMHINIYIYQEMMVNRDLYFGSLFHTGDLNICIFIFIYIYIYVCMYVCTYV
jgi:hypothetical protein